jgi:hypothetical protein
MSKTITLAQWDAANIDQRSEWIRSGTLIREEDRETLIQRFEKEEAEIREYVKQSKRLWD